MAGTYPQAVRRIPSVLSRSRNGNTYPGEPYREHVCHRARLEESPGIAETRPASSPMAVGNWMVSRLQRLYDGIFSRSRSCSACRRPATQSSCLCSNRIPGPCQPQKMTPCFSLRSLVISYVRKVGHVTPWVACAARGRHTMQSRRPTPCQG